nr:MAG TPA: hypothetical protein [Bacteriophage sp.]
MTSIFPGTCSINLVRCCPDAFFCFYEHYNNIIFSICQGQILNSITTYALYNISPRACVNIIIL